MKSHSTRLLFLALALASGAVAYAQSSPVRPQYSFPESPSTGSRGAAAIQLGNSSFYAAPFATGSIGQDDNLYQSANNATRSWLGLLGVGVMIDSRGPSRVFRMSYMGTAGRYTSARNDDYVDHSFQASFDALATREIAFRADYDFIRGHDARGSTDRQNSARPDIYHTSTPGILAAYGTKDATGRFEGFYTSSRKRYQNNRTVTAGSDLDTGLGGAAAYFRVMPRTQVVAEYRRTDLDYVQAGNPLDSKEERFYGGVTWDATAATSGTVKVGRLKKTFTSGAPDFSGTGWEGQVTWTPLSYSKFDFYSSRQPVESTGQGTFILSDATGVIWSHAWSSFWATEAAFRFQKDKYQGFNRTDDLTVAGLRANYQFQRWLTLGAEYRYTDRDSTVPTNDYSRNIWFLTVKGTL